MKQVILTCGLPGSGKSTWAKEKLAKEPDKYIRLNRDDMRMMFNNKYRVDTKTENLTLIARDYLLVKTLEAGKNVIIDDCNLSPKHLINIRALVSNIPDTEVVVQDFSDVPLDVCISRDLHRGDKAVGHKVITDMYNQFIKHTPPVIKYDPALPSTIISDLDGTLFLLGGRSPYDPSTCQNDPINTPVYEIIKDKHVIFITGRDEKFRPQTEMALKKHGITNYILYMRPNDDRRKDSVVKQEIFNLYIRNKYNVSFVLEDRTRNVVMFRDLGLTCMQVAEGDF